jgi:hypothetical protein
MTDREGVRMVPADRLPPIRIAPELPRQPAMPPSAARVTPEDIPVGRTLFIRTGYAMPTAENAIRVMMPELERVARKTTDREGEPPPSLDWYDMAAAAFGALMDEFGISDPRGRPDGVTTDGRPYWF